MIIDYIKNFLIDVKNLFFNFGKHSKNKEKLKEFKLCLNIIEKDFKNEPSRLIDQINKIEFDQENNEGIELNSINEIEHFKLEIEKKIHNFEVSIGKIEDLFDDKIFRNDPYAILSAKNKENTRVILDEMRLNVHELNTLFYSSLKFGQVKDETNFNKQFIENITGLDENNLKLPMMIEQEHEESKQLISLIDRIEKLISIFQDSLSIIKE